MSLAAASDRTGVVPLRPVWVFALLAFVLALRILHWTSALQSPLSYQPGPDEDYYQRFGAAVASGQGAGAAEFTFMDPGYGYVLGAVFKVTGVNPFAVYLLQALLDTLTALGILVAGRQLGRPFAGLYGAALYGVTATAIMFSAALLKETAVASFCTWWVVGALALCRSPRKLPWVAFGAFCGIGVALRSTLLLLAVAALLLPALAVGDDVTAGVPAGRRRGGFVRAALVLAGLVVALLPWSIRNARDDGSLSPLPHNGGIVLHQAYNPDNPRSAIWIPAFVSYLHPSEIWRGYSAEAVRRAGRPLAPAEVDAYWRHEAVEFMVQHPAQVAADVARKALVFLADSEIPNNRSSAEERLFSPVLALLPPPMAWLLAMGLAGLAWLAIQDRRWLIVAMPVAIAWFTMAVFWAEDRFRFHAVPVLALLAGVWVDAVVRSIRGRRLGELAAFGSLALVIGATSVYLGRQYPPPQVRWDHVVWGYIRMGQLKTADGIAERVAREQPDNSSVMEALGYLSAKSGQFDQAVQHYQRAIALRPGSYLAHYNLAKAFLALGERGKAADEARVAVHLDPSPDSEALLREAEDSR